MQYTVDEALQETMRRAEALRRKRDRRVKHVLLGGTAVLACALFGFAYELVPHGFSLGETAYGAFLLPSEAGGYILAGVAAFIIGVLVTMLCLRYSGRNRADSGADREPGTGPGDFLPREAADPGGGREEGPEEPGKTEAESENNNKEGEIK